MTDEDYMRMALRQAQMAFDDDEIPIGAVIVQDGKILAKAYNQTERLKDSTAHAEIMALTTAYQHLGSKYVPQATLYVTIEPCLMCSGALYWSKISRVVIGALDEKNGYRRVAGENNPFHPKTEIVQGVLAEDCASLMRAFFKARR